VHHFTVSSVVFFVERLIASPERKGTPDAINTVFACRDQPLMVRVRATLASSS